MPWISAWHPYIWVPSWKNHWVLTRPSSVDSCRDGAEKEECTIHYLRTCQRTMPMSFMQCILQSGLVPLLACYDYQFCTVRSLQEVPGETEAAVILYVNWSAESQRWLVGKYSSVRAFRYHITITCPCRVQEVNYCDEMILKWIWV